MEVYMDYQCIDSKTGEYILTIMCNRKLVVGQVVTHPESGQRYEVVSTEPIDHRMVAGQWYARLRKEIDSHG